MRSLLTWSRLAPPPRMRMCIRHFFDSLAREKYTKGLAGGHVCKFSWRKDKRLPVAHYAELSKSQSKIFEALDPNPQLTSYPKV
jgi:hypothetical protein